MPRYRAIPSTSTEARVNDMRQADGNSDDAAVTIEPASSTTHDEPQLTEPANAPEASPAKTSTAGKSETAKGATKSASKKTSGK